jgi:hypothetical protein
VKYMAFSTAQLQAERTFDDAEQILTVDNGLRRFNLLVVLPDPPGFEIRPRMNDSHRTIRRYLDRRRLLPLNVDNIHPGRLRRSVSSVIRRTPRPLWSPPTLRALRWEVSVDPINLDAEATEIAPAPQASAADSLERVRKRRAVT